MKKIRITAALVLAFVLVFGTTAFAATSPTSGVVIANGYYACSVSQVTDQGSLQSLTNAITSDAAAMGLTPIVRACLNVSAPAGYVSGTKVPLTWTVSGVSNGSVVYAYHRTSNGTVERISATVKDGKVSFSVSSFSPIAIVEFVASTGSTTSSLTTTVANATNTAAGTVASAPATTGAAEGGLHQTGDTNEVVILACIAGVALITLAVNKKGIKA